FPGYNLANKQQDRAEALSLMAEAGFSDGFETTLVCRNVNVTWCEWFTGSLVDLGIDMKINSVDTSTSDDLQCSGDYDVIVQTDPIGDGDPDDYGDPVDLAIDTTSTSVSFDTTGLTGLFVLTVTMTVSSLDPAVFQPSVLPGTVRVSTAPPIIWLGALTATQGAIFQGVNFEDNAGSAFTTVNDMDGDGIDDFIIVARYGKPFLDNSSGGIGHGEAYLIYGSGERLSGELNLNSVGTDLLRGVTFTGIRTPQGIDDTDGLADVSRVPDLDSDGRDEIIFGFPNVDSRGHNADVRQDGVWPEDALATLERHDQFLRGGVVIVSSKNSILQSPTSGTPVVNLDMVGQDFDITCVRPEPDVSDDDFFLNNMSVEEQDNILVCVGTCTDPQSDDFADSNSIINYGFHEALAGHYFDSMVLGGSVCASTYFLHFGLIPPCNLFNKFENLCGPGSGICTPTSPGLHWQIPFAIQRSGYYPYEFDINADEDDEEDIVLNRPIEPLGARIIGVGIGDSYGTSITLSNATGSGSGDIIISSPDRTAIGILRQSQDFQFQGPEDGDGYVQGGEIDGLEDASGNWTSHSSSGVAYMFSLRNLWENDSFGRIPPKPHHYIVGEGSHCGGPAGVPFLIENIDATRIAGNTGQKIRNIVGINDFNGDGLNDFAVGAPTELGGTLHIVYRRLEALEGDVVLSKLELDPSDPERLQGSFITGNTGDVNGEGFGASMVAGFDFDGDGLQDLVVSTPNDSLGTGAVDIIFTSPGLITPQGGTTIEDLRNDRRSVRITGLEGGDLFGFNVANAGDVDGDGLDDLLIAAPGASPKHDPNPNDSVDELSAPGLDVNGDGVADFTLDDAGLVYLILGSNVLGDDSFFDQDRFPDGIINISALGTSDLRGVIIVGKAEGDRLGGGDAGSLVEGGITDKAGRGRSFGLKAAGDIDGDGKADILMGSVLADFVDPITGAEKKNTGEAYLLYGFEP
ncbi:MAG: FG-GAP repeat protein, partial [Planctomycetes bacterium]|nr:FG-GAP repeat protein [Planctomycetota bacterium]